MELWDVYDVERKKTGKTMVRGDSSQTAAERELQEELGIHLKLQGIRPNMTINFDRGFDDIYLIEKDVDLRELKLQYEEVQAAKWATKEEILEMIKTGQFIPYYDSLIQLFFDSRKKYGCHRK